jgi:hypothetical protein
LPIATEISLPIATEKLNSSEDACTMQENVPRSVQIISAALLYM